MSPKKKQGGAGNEKTKPDEDMLDLKSIESLKHKAKKIIYHEAGNYSASGTAKRPREIVIQAEVLPFRFTTRAHDFLNDGKPWRHDGGEVSFHITQAHDELELYTLQGEFVKSYPVSASGQVQIPDMEKGIYLLFLRGRKISSLSSTD